MTYRTLGKRVQRVHALQALPSLSGKVVLVTGGTDGVGRALVAQLAAAGAKVLATARSRAKGEQLREQLGSSVEIIDMDLASLASVRDGAADVRNRTARLDLVLCNAAHQGHGQRQLTADGFEMTFAVNHLAHALLLRELLPVVERTPSGTVVVVASEAHRRAKDGLDFDDLDMARGEFRPSLAYSRSKLANVLYAHELSRHTTAPVRTVHPGGVDTPMMRAMLSPLQMRILYPLVRRTVLISPDDAAAGVLRVALDPVLENVTSRYFELGQDKLVYAPARNVEAASRLWNVTQELLSSY